MYHALSFYSPTICGKVESGHASSLLVDIKEAWCEL
jgi:hypothetical protein